MDQSYLDAMDVVEPMPPQDRISITSLNVSNPFSFSTNTTNVFIESVNDEMAAKSFVTQAESSAMGGSIMAQIVSSIFLILSELTV